MTQTDPAAAPVNYANIRFAADLPPLTPEQRRRVEHYLARPTIMKAWTPLARRAAMEAMARSDIDPDDPQSLAEAVRRGNVAPVLPVDNRTPYFPASKPWTSKCTAVIREQAGLTVRLLGTRALILTEQMALHVGDFAEYMRDKTITDYFDEVGTPLIDGGVAAFMEPLAGREAATLVHAIIKREYGEFRPVHTAQAAEFRGGPPAVDQPGIRDLIEARRLAHAAFDRDFAALRIDLFRALERELRQLYPWR
ncbi:MAG: hypothetical protein JF615_06725 [Asticcacaulis sp.]|nr:hypothetical protein [Asticcacaulis sp.]